MILRRLFLTTEKMLCRNMFMCTAPFQRGSILDNYSGSFYRAFRSGLVRASKVGSKRYRSETKSVDNRGMRPLRPWASPQPHINRNKIIKAIHLFRCRDQQGLVASISELIRLNGGNMLGCDLFVDADPTTMCAKQDDGSPSPAVFHSRSTFTYDPKRWDPLQLEEDFQNLHLQYDALQSEVHCPLLQEKPKVGLLCSVFTHCVVELLHRYESNELPPCEITVCVSNHNHSPDSVLRQLLRRHNIDFHYIPASTADRHEEDILNIVQSQTDVLVLARYMQILSPTFLTTYGRDILNIHHGLLPSFKGANPYRQAYEAGVKIIGATAHFVTPVLDEGPIIEQLVDRVSHRDSLHEFKTKTRALERQCLFNAVSYYLDYRILRYSKERCAILN